MAARALIPFLLFVVAAASGGAQSGGAAGAAARERFWPQWRGPFATGVSRSATPPTEWSETKNIRWKVEIPGRGSSSPVVWGDRMFVLSAVPIGVDAAASHAPRGGLPQRDRYRFVVMALDRRTGKTVWERVAREEQPHEATHGDNGTYASSSAITDGQRVYAWFESQGMYVYDMDGKLLWSKDLGDKKMRNQFGEGSTPVLAGDRLVIVWDQIAPGGSFVVSLDASRRTRAVARRARRDRHLGHAARRRARADAARRSSRGRTRSAATTSRTAASSGRARA